MGRSAAVETFKRWLTTEYAARLDEGIPEILEGDEAHGADLSLRLPAGPRSFYEARVDLSAGEVQVGLSTTGRTVNEEIEEMILENGGDLDDLLADELDEMLGDDWDEVSMRMEHFFERPAFRFITRLKIASPAALQDPLLRRRVLAVLKASRVLFQEFASEE